MNPSISDDIKEVIFQNGSVVIPGLGAFTSSYKSATVDMIQGQMSPPSLEISYDPNLIINDGVLLDFIKKKYQITTQEAQSRIDAFTEFAVNTFKNHEILVITDVGRLYKDYTDKIRYLPENTNFNQDTFGLPAVQFYPVSRSKPEVIVPQTNGAETVKPPVATPAQTLFSEPVTKQQPFLESVDNISTPLIPERSTPFDFPFDIKKMIPGIAAALVVIMAFCVYLFTKSDNGTAKTARQAKVKPIDKPVPAPPKVEPKQEEDFVQIAPLVSTPPPPANDKGAKTSKPQDIASEKYYEDTKSKSKNSENLTITEGVNKSVAPDAQNQATIIIGGFANKSNINRLKSWIKSNNYGLYERKSGGLTVVGAEINYKDKKELSAILKRFRSRYGDEVELMKK